MSAKTTYRIRPLDWRHWTFRISDGLEYVWQADSVMECSITRTERPNCELAGYSVQWGNQKFVLGTLEESKAWLADQHHKAVAAFLEVSG